MLPNLGKIKGVHPGAILKRALRQRGMAASDLARAIDEHKQTLSAVLNGRRSVNPKLSIKLAEVFDVAPDYFMVLQAGYDVKQTLESTPKQTPDLKRFRKALFWDTQLDKIDWNKNKRAVIKRVLERGNQQEIEELIKFYGKQTILKVVQSIKTSYLPSFEENVKHYSLSN